MAVSSRVKLPQRNIPYEEPISKGYTLSGIVVFILILFFEFVGVRSLYESMTSIETIPVRQFQIVGKLKYLSNKELRQHYMNEFNTQNMLTIQTAYVRRHIESLPWVNNALVTKRLPDILYIYVEEHEPIAYFNEGILTKNWQVIYPNKVQINNMSAHLYGNVNEARRIYTRYQELENFLQPHNFSIMSLSLSEYYEWSIVLTNGINLRLGRELTFDDGDILDENNLQTSNDLLLARLQNFIEIYPKIEKRDLIEYVDLRYDVGAAVKLKTEQLDDKEK